MPKACRFEVTEVTIEKLLEGSVVLHPKSAGLLGDRLWAALDGVPDDQTFVKADQGEAEVREWLDDESGPKGN